MIACPFHGSTGGVPHDHYDFRTCHLTGKFHAAKDIVIDLLAIVFEGKSPLVGATVEVIDISEDDNDDPQSLTSSKGNTFRFPLERDKKYKVLVSMPKFSSDSANAAAIYSTLAASIFLTD